MNRERHLFSFTLSPACSSEDRDKLCVMSGDITLPERRLKNSCFLKWESNSKPCFPLATTLSSVAHNAGEYYSENITLFPL